MSWQHLRHVKRAVDERCGLLGGTRGIRQFFAQRRAPYLIALRARLAELRAINFRMPDEIEQTQARARGSRWSSEVAELDAPSGGPGSCCRTDAQTNRFV